MNFREFVNNDERRQSYNRPAPIQEQYQEPEDYQEYEDEEEEYYEPEPPKVIPKKPVQKQVVYRQPVQRKIVRQAMPIDQYNRPIQINKRQLAENTIESTANTLTEAIKRKVDTIFYRFGIQGLEKLDEKILDTIEELQYPEPKPIKKSGVNMRRVPAKRIVRKPKPLPIQDIQPPQVYEEPEEIYEEDVQQEPYEEMVEQQQPIVEEEQVVEQEEAQPVIKEQVEQKPTEPNIFDVANKLLDIEPERELKHEVGVNNPVFTPQPPAQMIPEQTPTMVFEVPPVENKLVTMPSLDEFMQQDTPVEVAQVPEEPTQKKTRRSRKKEETTNEEK